MKWFIAFVLVAVVGAGCARRATNSSVSVSPESPSRTGVVVKLPQPKMDGTVSLERALAERRSVRSFADGELTREQLSQLLWAGDGITRWNTGGRTAPSAGALYPIEIFVADKQGLWRYVAREHAVEQVREGDVRAQLAEAAYGQTWVGEASAVFVITASEKVTAEKYRERAPRYVTLEGGHVCQNLLLEATALGLGGTPVGSFTDASVAGILSLSRDRQALYVVPVGKPAK